MSRTPHPEELAGDLFKAMAASGTLQIQRCSTCAAAVQPPRYFCPECGSADMVIGPSSGVGVVVSWTTVSASAEALWQAQVPYDVLVVELSDGPRVVALAHGFDETPKCGTAVTVAVEVLSDDFVRLIASPAQMTSQHPPTST